MTIIPSETRIERSKKEHNSTIIFFHGMTLSNCHVGHFNSNMQEKFPNTKFIFPQASRKKWAVEGMFGCENKENPTENTNWYCIKATLNHLFTPNPPQNIEELEKWAEKVQINDNHLNSLILEIHEIIKTEIDNGIKPKNIVISGWSQGGSVALITGLTFPEPLGGIVCLSSFLPWNHKTYGLINNATEEKKKVPIIFCNGTDDRLVPFWTGEISSKILKLCGYKKIEFHAYQKQGHSTNCDKELNSFLRKILKKDKTNDNSSSTNWVVIGGILVTSSLLAFFLKRNRIRRK